jgi:hypothetical protein
LGFLASINKGDAEEGTGGMSADIIGEIASED